MPKPPPSPPSSDIGGVTQSRIAPNDPRRWDQRAQAQLEAETHELVGRPDADGPVAPPKRGRDLAPGGDPGFADGN
jgi:hypothetical protein